jgi:hypothetical protein
MSEGYSSDSLPSPVKVQVDGVCGRFRRAWQVDQWPRIEYYLLDCPEEIRGLLFGELLLLEVQLRQDNGAGVLADEYRRRFPDRAAEIETVLSRLTHSSGSRTQAGAAATEHPANGWLSYRSAAEPCRDAPSLPQEVGRYRIERLLGRGGYGLVYLAQDDQLNRAVAIKVPHRHLILAAQDAADYLHEAQAAASLDHPHIVPVYDVGGTEEQPCFVVSKYIAGSSLAVRMGHR